MCDIYGNYPPDLLALSVEDRALAWMLMGEKGISSKTIWAVCADVETSNPLFVQLSKSGWNIFGDTPNDPNEFRKCYLLLRLIPEWRERFPRVSVPFPAWRPFVENWDELTEIFETGRENISEMGLKLYARLKELRAQADAEAGI